MKDSAKAASTTNPTTPPNTNEMSFAEIPKRFNMLPPETRVLPNVFAAIPFKSQRDLGLTTTSFLTIGLPLAGGANGKVN
jgi:hypothetical protein